MGATAGWQDGSRTNAGDRLPPNDWPAWSGFVALIAALVLAAVAAAIVDVPASVLGVKIVSSSRIPPGIELGDTFVQDLMFILTAVLFAGLGGRVVRSWQLGLRPTRLWRAVGLVLAIIVAFLIFSAVWAAILHVNTKEDLLEKLGTNETTLLLVLSALLTTVVAPIAEETLFRGYIFGALAKWRGWLPGALATGVLFGLVHATSAPAVDLLPLAVLGFLLCWVYAQTGSLYPGIVIHSLNNSLAFGALEGWSWQILVLACGALLAIWLLAVLLRGVGVISPAPPARSPDVPTITL